jgi:hypothetical protein
MIERRKQSRVRVEVRVEISGKDAACEVFSQSVIAGNLSRSGALLRGVRGDLRCGDLVTLKYGERQAKFRIVWLLDRGAMDGVEVAVHRIADSPCPWEAVLNLPPSTNGGQGTTVASDQEEVLLEK